MAVTSGFFNSIDDDRRYDAIQMGEIFDGIINPGVYASIGTACTVKENTGMTVEVGVGRAWWLHSWIYVNAPELVTIDPADLVYPRIDCVVLDFDSTEDVRANTIKYVKGVAAANPVPPSLIDSTDHKQVPLCEITVDRQVTAIGNNKIRNLVGTSQCPFVTGPLKVLDVENLINQWEGQLTDDVAFNLLSQINTLDRNKAPIVNPIFEGVPTVPTPTTPSSTNQAANTSWVNSRLLAAAVNPLTTLFYNITETTTLLIPSTTRYIYGLLIGGGGGGGGNGWYNSYDGIAGGGGGGGDVVFLRRAYNSTINVQVTITIGAGGIGGAGGTVGDGDGKDGGTGGVTSINNIQGNTIYAYGGNGGGGGRYSNGTGGKGGVGSSGGGGGGGVDLGGSGGDGKQFGGGGGGCRRGHVNSNGGGGAGGKGGPYGGGGGGGGAGSNATSNTTAIGGQGGNGGVMGSGGNGSSKAGQKGQDGYTTPILNVSANKFPEFDIFIFLLTMYRHVYNATYDGIKIPADYVNTGGLAGAFDGTSISQGGTGGGGGSGIYGSKGGGSARKVGAVNEGSPGGGGGGVRSNGGQGGTTSGRGGGGGGGFMEFAHGGDGGSNSGAYTTPGSGGGGGGFGDERPVAGYNGQRGQVFLWLVQQ